MVLLTTTIVSHSTSSILKHITKILGKSTSSYGLLAVLSPSPSLPESQLSDLVAALTAVPNSVGCISSCLPLRSREPATSVSLALFETSKNTPWRSTIPGRKPTSIGRSHSVRSKEVGTDQVNERRSPQTVLDEIRGLQRYALPNNICGLNPEEAQTILYLSDHSPEGLSESLFSSFPLSSQLGFLAAPTPFLTGLPFTLFCHHKIVSDGAVGICLPSPVSQFRIDYPSLTAITDTLTVTSVEGNLIHSLNDTNPAKLIISAMDNYNTRKSGDTALCKEDQYYLGVLGDDDKPTRLYQIMSGGPSRGIVALEGEDGPRPGARAQLYHLPSSPQALDRSVKQNLSQHTFHFLNLYRDELSQTAAFFLEAGRALQDQDGTVVLRNTFLAASEYGCLVKRPQGEAYGPWRYSVPTGCTTVTMPTTHVSYIM